MATVDPGPTTHMGGWRMGSGRANPLTLRKNRYKNKRNLVLGDQFCHQNPPFKVNNAGNTSFQLRKAQSTYGDDCANMDLLTEDSFRWGYIA